MSPGVAAEVERYLRTGDTDPRHAAWRGVNFIESATRANADLENALIDTVRHRAGSWNPSETMRGLDVVAFTRQKVEPMVRGLFARAEQDAVLGLVQRSVIFLTPDNIEDVLRREMRWPHSAWIIANVYLGGIGSQLLSEDALGLMGFSQEATCFVSPAYFEEADPFADFVVHEVAHIFHNCKRHVAGLMETHRREWLLDIDFRKREKFAYACEAYARIVERARTRAERVMLADELGDDFGTGDGRVGNGEVAEVVRQAVTRRNGWKTILASCSATAGTRRGVTEQPDPEGSS